MESIERYEAGMQPVRDRFGSAPAVETITSPAVDPDILWASLLYFCALAMTEPVEGRIHRAGARCMEAGCVELALQRRAEAEAGHHLLMIGDLRTLCGRWNARARSPLDPDKLLTLPRSEAPERYWQLHEDVIAGPAPYAQIAIEHEIEMLSVDCGPALLDSCAQRLGEDVFAGLRFLVEHVELDVGHTRRMARLLQDRRPLVSAGPGR